MNKAPMKHITFLFFTLSILFLGFESPAQTRRTEKPFEFIDSTSDVSSIELIQTFRCSGKKGEGITALYRTIKQKAQERGANCYVFNEFTRDSLGRMTLMLDTYYADAEFIRQNAENLPQNTVYLVSDGNFDRKDYSFKINKKKYLLKSGTYYQHSIEKKQKVTINKGGVMGTTATIHWEESKPCQFYSLSGFGLANFAPGMSPVNYGGNGLSLAFTSGKLKRLDRNFGLLLTRILKQQP